MIGNEKKFRDEAVGEIGALWTHRRPCSDPTTFQPCRDTRWSCGRLWKWRYRIL